MNKAFRPEPMCIHVSAASNYVITYRSSLAENKVKVGWFCICFLQIKQAECFLSPLVLNWESCEHSLNEPTKRGEDTIPQFSLHHEKFFRKFLNLEISTCSTNCTLKRPQKIIKVKYKSMNGVWRQKCANFAQRFRVAFLFRTYKCSLDPICQEMF